MDHLSTGMYSGVGTTCSMHNRERAGDPLDCFFQGSLYRWPMTRRLSLEAVIVGAIVLNTAGNNHSVKLHERDLSNLGGITFAASDFDDACVAARTTDVA